MLKPHDITTYKQLCDMIIKYGECCLIGIPGVGKTRISNHFVEEYNLNVLVISPRNEINNSWQYWNTVSERGSISTITVQQFYKNFALYTTGFDLYIFDECHCLGAKKWGKSYFKFKKLISDDCIILGLTATPNRYFDQNYAVNNVGETVFNNHTVYCISRSEAIKLGVISNTRYVCALYDLGYLAKHYSKKNMTEELRGRLDYALKNQPAIADILRKHAPKSNKKGIVFVDKIDSIDDGIEVIRKAFPEEKIWCVHSKMGKTQYRKNCEEFKNADSGFIVNVDILSEGIHHNGVNMVIMLRKTCSPTKFTQQTGRVSNAEESVIFDFAANNVSVTEILRRIKTSKNEFMGVSNGTSKEVSISDQEIVADYSSGILKIMEDIDEYNSASWSEEEDKILRENYPTIGRNVCNLLPGRTKQACRMRATKLGIKSINNIDEWDTQEIEILKKYYPEMGIEIVKLIPNRSAEACTVYAAKLGIKSNRYWTENEDNILKDNYPKMGPNVYKLLTGRSATACEARSRKLKINFINRWAEDEDDIIRQYYPTEGANVVKRLPGRTECACKARAVTLGIKWIRGCWTEDEDDIIRQYYPTEGAKVVKRLPGRTKTACKSRADKLGIEWIRGCWTEDEDKILRDHYLNMGRDIVKLLPNRSYSSCSSRATKLKITNIERWTQEENDIIKNNYPNMGPDVYKLLPGRTRSACAKRASYLGLKMNN